MSDVLIRTEGRAGCITMSRPEALNALTARMAFEIEIALDAWRENDAVDVIIVDSEGDKAFCAGGDIAELYAKGTAGDFGFGQDFWRQEYRLNLKIAHYPKPVVTFMQGFTMGGGVGLGCHASHRIVGEGSKIAMPECGIGLVPDVGGSHLLGRAPGSIGVFLGLTGARMGPMDAIHVGFADHYVPLGHWDGLKSTIKTSGSIDAIFGAEVRERVSPMADEFRAIAGCFERASLADIAECLAADESEAAQKALKGMKRGSPLSMACALDMIRAAGDLDLGDALALEYRFSYRSQEHSDFLEGIRAQIVDKDFAPKWRHTGFDVAQNDIDNMLAPLGDHEWNG